MRIILLAIFVQCVNGCGKLDVNVPDTKQEVSVNLGFERAAAFCDDRYGYKTEESEVCFEDYRNFTTVELKLDVSGLLDYCNTVYQDELDVNTCIADLTSIIQGLPDVTQFN